MTPRTYHSACSGDGRLFVYGGVNEFDIAALEVLDLDSLKMYSITTIPVLRSSRPVAINPRLADSVR
jgi:hypothetical protein